MQPFFTASNVSVCVLLVGWRVATSFLIIHSLHFHFVDRIAFKCNFHCEFRQYSIEIHIINVQSKTFCRSLTQKCTFRLCFFSFLSILPNDVIAIFPSTNVFPTITLSASTIYVLPLRMRIKIHFVHISLFYLYYFYHLILFLVDRCYFCG